MSGKVHSEHIVVTKVLMPVGRGCLGKYTLSTLLLQKCSCPWGGGGGRVSGKVHSEHIVATKVLMPMEGGGGSGKVQSEHIGRFRAGGKQSRFELPSCLIMRTA